MEPLFLNQIDSSQMNHNDYCRLKGLPIDSQLTYEQTVEFFGMARNLPPKKEPDMKEKLEYIVDRLVKK